MERIRDFVVIARYINVHVIIIIMIMIMVKIIINCARYNFLCFIVRRSMRGSV